MESTYLNVTVNFYETSKNGFKRIAKTKVTAKAIREFMEVCKSRYPELTVSHIRVSYNNRDWIFTPDFKTKDFAHWWKLKRLGI